MVFYSFSLGVRIRGTLGDIDPLNKVPFKRARSRVQKGYPLRGLPNDTTYSCYICCEDRSPTLGGSFSGAVARSHDMIGARI